MSIGKILAIIGIYLGASVAWMILGVSMTARTDQRDNTGGEAVEALWGGPHRQAPPQAALLVKEQVPVPAAKGVGPNKETYKTVTHQVPLSLEGSDVQVDLKSEPRQKGLLWYRTYRVGFHGTYRFKARNSEPAETLVSFAFPTQQAIYDGFHLRLNGKEAEQPLDAQQGLAQQIRVEPGKDLKVEVEYRSQGMDNWTYGFGDGVNRVKDFHLALTTDFRDIDFPAQSLSPTTKVAAGQGWKLGWDYESLISGFQIGMDMPQKLNPGPLAARMSFFAPVSLGFFFFLMFIITVVRDIKLHPMHYLFLAAGFFAFHLLFSYLADQIPPLPAFIICTVVSVGLVVSYLRLVTGARFAWVEAGISQLVYLVLFSYAFFFEGVTGLAITLLSIASLFVVMQLTGGVNWEKKLKPVKARAPRRSPSAAPQFFVPPMQ
jgi:hypothetical protein